MAHRVYHWKHGWIPLDGVALQEKNHAAAIHQLSKTPRMSPGGASFDEIMEKVDNAPHVQIVTHTAAGQPHVSPLIGVLDQRPDEFTDAQKREVAGYAEEVFQRFPGLHQGLDQSLEAVQPNDSYWGATDAMSRKHKVALATALWDGPTVRSQMADWSENHGAIAGQVSTQKEFRHRTVLHEMGHVVHLRAQDQGRIIRKTGAARAAGMVDGTGTYRNSNPVDAFVNESVTPRQMGFTHVAPGGSERELDQPVPRWMADSLDRKSAYASSSPYEFYAEAFLDGMVNGNGASESGKRAVALADQLFGKAAA